MNGYFSRLARSTGMRLGARDGGGSAPPMPVGYDPPASPQPLEVEESRIASPADERGEPARSGSGPGNGAVTDAAAQVPPVEEGVMRIREVESVPLDPADRPGRPDRGEERIPAVIRIDDEVSRERAVPVASEHPNAPVTDPMIAGGDAPRKEEGTPVEEFVVRMIEGDLGTHPSGDERPQIDRAARSLLRDVIGWIGSPPGTPDDLPALPLEEVASSEFDERSDGAPLPDGLPRKEGADLPVRRQDFFEMMDLREPPPSHHDPHGSSPREPGISDFTLSIGSIRIVIEEPVPQGNVPAPPQRPDAGAGEKRPEPSRLSRHYI